MIHIQHPSKHLLLLASLLHPAVAQTACIKGGGYEFTFDGACEQSNFIAGFKDVYDDALLKPAGCSNTIEQELAAQLGVSTASLATGIKDACKAAQDAKQVITLHDVPPQKVNKGGRFVSDYYNGGTHWNLETETLLFPSDGTTAEQTLKTDAANVDSYYDHAQREPFVWPNELPQFNLDECELQAAQCCWPQDRQAKDNNGNCATPYDTNCVDKDPGDNTDLCMVDLSYAPENNFVKSSGYSFFPGDNNSGEGPIHCHGFAWGNDDMDVLARYKANNLFYVSMYDHMYQRGYVRNIAGAPMCGCLEKMPIVSRSDCTQTNVSEQYKFTKMSDTKGFQGEIKKATLQYQACQGANNKNNDLEAYYQRLVNEGRITAAQQAAFKAYIVGNNQCQSTIDAFLADRSYTAGFAADAAAWTYVVGEGDLRQEGEDIYDGLQVTAMFHASPHKIMRRACLKCYASHKDIYYKRLTPLPENMDILNLMMNDWTSKDNLLNVDFELYSDYNDAIAGDPARRWTYCNYDDLGIGFPRDCGPTGRVNWNWNSYYRGGGAAEHHSFFVEANADFEYGLVNIAADRTASQSSERHGGVASRAVDGNTVGIWNWSTVTHTSWNQQPSWEVWLGTDAVVDKVYFWNRIDCCRNYLADVRVDLLDGMGSGDVVATKTIAGQLPVMNVVDFGGATGQTVRITVTTGGWKVLMLAEVKVTGEIDEANVLTNVALGAAATSSSEAYGGRASRAIDGSTNGHWNNKSVTHSHRQSNPWWKVKMAAAHSVQTIQVWNRYDCCWDRLVDPIIELFRAGTLVRQIRYEGVVPREGGAAFDFGGAAGDEVVVRMESGSAVLSLAEVQVFAKVLAPGATDAPSAAPSASPSGTPTAVGSDTPSAVPTGSPVADASDAPSANPSESPVAAASDTPSGRPTGSPVVGASSAPSSNPSESPVAAASDAPSGRPTGSPVVGASSAPTESPSAGPSAKDSDVPSAKPTATPVADASSAPTESPSAGPTAKDSDVPSSSPTGSPVVAASDSPSSAPSVVDSDVPSVIPTGSPSKPPVISVITQPAPTTPAPVVPGKVGGTAAPTLNEISTNYEGGNGQAGIMFDIEASSDLVIHEMDIHVGDAATHDGFVYTIDGTWRGFAKNATQWTQVGAFKVTGQGEGNASPLPADAFSPISVSSGETKGIYVTLTTAVMKYTYQTSGTPYEVVASDDHLAMLKGCGKRYSFAKNFVERVFNGSIRYALAVV